MQKSAQFETPPVVLTPRDVIMYMFPEGTQYENCGLLSEEVFDSQAWQKFPNWPPDLFAITAYLLNVTGAYHFISPGNSSQFNSVTELFFSKDELQKIKRAAQSWRNNLTRTPAWVQTEWSVILQSTRRLTALRQDDEGSQAPLWWRSALRLCLFADETCSDIGFNFDRDNDWLNGPIMSSWDGLLKKSGGKNLIEIHEGMYSLCIAASRDAVCVLPKSRTPSVGCTIRSISQNLNLLPSVGLVSLNWHQVPEQTFGPPKSNPFNCLFIPYPYHVDAEAFTFREPNETNTKRWRWFEVEQTWLPTKPADKRLFFAFVDQLILKSMATSKGILHCVVFPEFALNWDLFKDLCNHIMEAHESIEMVISGSSTNCKGAAGNYVLTCQIVETTNTASSKVERRGIFHSREKHHRWLLDENQVKEYDLEEQLPIDGDVKMYWEMIPIERRNVHANIFRKHSVITTLICEDLARSEPCHQYVQAIGPNIVFALLMDSVQISQRWPGRDAISLSDDPGASVVTLTSRGLIARSNRKRMEQALATDSTAPNLSWSVSLARNPNGELREIECGKGEEAFLLSFRASTSHEVTIAGTHSSLGSTWLAAPDEWKISLDRQDNKQLELLKRVVIDYD